MGNYTRTRSSESERLYALIYMGVSVYGLKEIGRVSDSWLRSSEQYLD